MLGINEIKKILPHRTPFLLIDRIDEMEPGLRVKGFKNVTYNEPFFQGHFPEEPVMPGVLIIEALAQTGAVLILSEEKNLGKTAFFAGIDNAKFKDKVIPGDSLVLEVEMIKIKGPFGIGKATAYKNGKVCVQAQLTFVVQ